jgi:hypothetical protein
VIWATVTPTGTDFVTASLVSQSFGLEYAQVCSAVGSTTIDVVAVVVSPLILVKLRLGAMVAPVKTGMAPTVRLAPVLVLLVRNIYRLSLLVRRCSNVKLFDDAGIEAASLVAVAQQQLHGIANRHRGSIWPVFAVRNMDSANRLT